MARTNFAKIGKISRSETHAGQIFTPNFKHFTPHQFLAKLSDSKSKIGGF